MLNLLGHGTRNEGCLCLPDYSGPVKRRNKIKFQAYDLHGNKFLYSAMGYEAAVIQHEFDHLNGILFWDHIVSGAGVKKR
ncbi:MAG TPA: hypothetical protein ENH52_12675 [Nitrospirae bacterium]|nr:hypothetical protein [Nitrospirota bacterium]